MREAVEVLRQAADQGERAVMARVVEIEGFSTRPGDDIVAVDSSGTVHGSMLAGLGSQQLKDAAASLLAGASDSAATVTVDVHDKDAVSAGLACGGRARLLLQPAATIPKVLWDLLARRAPAALLSKVEGDGSLVVERDGTVHGGDPQGWPVHEAVAMLVSGRTGTQSIQAGFGPVLVEAWVPDPRVVIVGSGELVEAIGAQAGLLGWESRAGGGIENLAGLLDWAGLTGALVVLSHDPHVDTPALEEGLRSGMTYVGALGSRSTQSKRTERLLADGVAQADIDRIHRPIGLDLGGRRAPEVALSIVAEILASHCGRDARPLSTRSGPIH